jgi:gliding motility-associated lipoprotein GldH
MGIVFYRADSVYFYGMIKYKLLFAAMVSGLLLSCQPSDRVFIEHRDLSPELEWKREDARTFEVPIEDPNATYKMLIGFRFATGFPYQYAKVRVLEQTPSGNTSENVYSLKIRENNGDYIGEPGLDIWDSEHLVEPTKNYKEKGTYTYTISHDMEKEIMPLSMEVSLILDKVSAPE